MSTIRIDILLAADEALFFSNGLVAPPSGGPLVEDGAPFEFDLMIEGLSDSTDVEVQLPGGGIPGAVILHGTSATSEALEQIRALPWVEDATAS